MNELSLERLNWLSHVSYPFVEDSIMSGTDGSSSITLPTNALLDLQLTVYSSGSGSLSLISAEISPTENSILFTFRYTPVIGSPFDLPVSVPSSEAAWANLDYYRPNVHNVAPTWSLWPIFGSGVVLLAAGNGGKLFIFNNLIIEPTCVQLRNKHVVTSIDSPSLIKIAGDVKIKPGYNMVISELKEANTIRLSAVIGEGEGMPCAQIAPDPGNCSDLIYSINGATPDWYGDFVLEGGDGVVITSDKNNHKIIISTKFQACEPGCME